MAEIKSTDNKENVTVKEVLVTAKDLALTKQQEDARALQKQNAEFLNKCKKDKKVKVTFPEIYAQYLGKCMTLTFNGVAVTAYFDGQEHEYPEFVAKYLKQKVEDSMKINVPRNVYSKLY